MESLTEIKGIIFDYGGTLDSHGDHWSHIIYDAWLSAGVKIAVDDFRSAYVQAERLMARERIILPCDNFRSLMQKKLKAEAEFILTANPDCTITHESIVSAAEICYKSARDCVAEAIPLLADLSARVPLVLVSNFYGNIEEVTRDFGIRQYFKGIIESAVVGVRKPDPTIFRLGTIVLGIPPENTLVIGDSLRKDILPSRSIGCHTAWLKGRGWTPEEDETTDSALISNLSEITRKFHIT